HDVLRALAARLRADHPGFDLSARDLADGTLRASGLPGWDELALSGGYDCADRSGDQGFKDGFAHPDGCFRFRPDWSALGPMGEAMPVWPDHWDVTERTDAAHPFRLVTAPAHAFLNSSFNETPTSVAKAGRPTVLATASDLDRLGLADGDLVRLFNARGAVCAHAKAAGGQPDGVLVLEGLWPNAAFVGGIGVNALVGADPGAPNGGAAFHDVAVGMEAA
ncbi:MAG: molybdopterin dinucleotide binding domain-containing protein, partial [Pseudomonadota bacterium]